MEFGFGTIQCVIFMFFAVAAAVENPVKLVIYVPYNGEHIVKLHINHLLDMVDLFVIVESKSTFSGIIRDKFYSDMYPSYFAQAEKESKLLKLKFDSYPFPTNMTSSALNWKREKYQRDYGLSHIVEKMGNQSFVVITADMDEIVSRQALNKTIAEYKQLTHKPLYYSLTYLCYSFKWMKQDEWTKTFAINDQYIRKHLPVSLDAIRMSSAKNRWILPKSGWHCTKFMTPEMILLKMQSYSHSLDAAVRRPEIQNTEWISKCIRDGIDLLNRTAEWERLREYKGEYGYPHNCVGCNVTEGRLSYIYGDYTSASTTTGTTTTHSANTTLRGL